MNISPLLSIVWAPSIGIDLGFFTIRYYSLMFVLAFLLGYWILKKIFDREGLPPEKLDKLFIYVFIATFVGARLGHVFFYDWAYFSKHPEEILLPFRFSPQFEFTGYQGLASHGAAIAIPLTVWAISKNVIGRPFLWIMDRLVIVVALGGAFVRLGNLMNSEIVGLPTGTDYGFIFINNGEDFARHPAQLYESVCYFVSFIILYVLYRKGKGQYMGYLFGLFLVLIFGVRIAVEIYKENQEAFENAMILNMGQLLSIPFVLLGLYLMIGSFRRVYTPPALSKKKEQAPRKK